MSVLKCWLRSAVALLTLAGGVHAEMTVSQSNDPTASLDSSLVALLGQERNALEAVAPTRLERIITPPAPAARRGAGGAAVVATSELDAQWLDQQPAAKGDKEFSCLATALYFEARGETVKGQAAVAEVIMNRVENPMYPASICGVVNQGNSRGCQFSYTCDGYADSIREPAAWERAAKIARVMIDGAPRALTDGATHFHTPAVRPAWASRFPRTARIGSHIFYRQPLRTAALN